MIIRQMENEEMNQTKRPQNPNYPEKLYSGASVEEFVRAYGAQLTREQVVTLVRLRMQGKLY